MKKKVLITGASGFVGYHLIVEALKSGMEVYAAVRASSDVKHLTSLDIKYTDLDYSSVEALRKNILAAKYDYIIHASGTTKAKSKAEYNRINADYTRNLASATIGTGVQKFIFVSSLAALGPLNDIGAEIQDDSAPQPVTSYGESKLLAEQYLKSTEHVPWLVIRPTAVYGPREKDLFIIFKSINMGLEPYIGRFEQQFSFIYVKDLASIIVTALASNIIHKAYNVSDGKKYNRYALANFSKNALKKKTFKFHLPVLGVSAVASLLDRLYAKSDTTPALNKEKMSELTAVNWACDISNLRSDLSYSPNYGLEKGIVETLAWYKKNNWLS